MRHLTGLVLVALMTLVPARARAQETSPPDGAPIKSARVSGFDLSRLSPGLQADIARLTGTSLDRQRLRELAARLEAEQPRFVAAVRVTADPDGGARVIFLVARIPDPDQPADINTKYIVEDVVIRGVRENAITAEMRADEQALIGKPLDSEVAERLEARLKAAFTDFDVVRRTGRGSERGRIKVYYHLIRNERSRWLRFEPMEADVVYHSDQGWGAKLPLTMSGDHLLIVPRFAISVTDGLVEEYSGFGISIESRKLGTERLGISFDWSSHEPGWRDATLEALAVNPDMPAAYRNRKTFSPLLKFAITPRLTVAGGMSVVELDPLDESSDLSRLVNAAVGSVRFNQQWDRASGMRHHVNADFTVRAGTAALESDLVYKRYVGQVSYLARKDRNRVLVSGMVGGITGTAPLFERFALGDSQTLRGWDKYAIAPAGGDRMFSASVEYRYRGLAVFLDSGSVWDAGADRRVRFSTGFGFTPGPAFFMLGFPLNTTDSNVVFTMGVRFTTAGFGFRKS
jgi:hypothetical protein